jgi:hypothetical protein
VILHRPGAIIIAWVSRVYVGVTPSQQGVLQITSLSTHLRGGYFELRRSQESEHLHPHTSKQLLYSPFAHQGKDIFVFRFIMEYSSLRDFGPFVIIIGLFLYDDILSCV